MRNHRPQLGPQHHHHHDKVRKNGFSYGVGLMQSIAYRRIRLLNRKTTMLFKQPTNVGLRSNWEHQSYVGVNFLAHCLYCVLLILHVLRYMQQHVRKPQRVTVQAFVTRMGLLNDYLAYLPTVKDSSMAVEDTKKGNVPFDKADLARIVLKWVSNRPKSLIRLLVCEC